MNPASLSPFANHIWQSTIFAALVMLLTLLLRNNRAHLRYSLWLAASIKFLVPFSLLVNAGALLEWRSAPEIAPPITSTIEQISTPFTTAYRVMPLAAHRPSNPATLPILLFAVVWLSGCAAVLSIWTIRWRRIRKAVRSATVVSVQAAIHVMSSPALFEPGVFGIRRPVLLLPEGISNRLTPDQLKAILAHELCHVRRRDNLAAAVHMLVEALFWFHPLVWWIGARLVWERERACDEEVLRLGNEPQAYAEGILNVCKFYIESPLACASGVTGADLKKRIEAIMTAPASHRLTLTRKLLLGTAAATAIAGPIFIGIMNAPQSRAQSRPDTLTFEVASIKPSNPDARGVRLNLLPGGGFRGENVRLRQLIEFAYEVHPFQISGGPGWMTSEGFDIMAKPQESADATDLNKLNDNQRERLADQVKKRVRALLADRFQLTIRREMKDEPIYTLVVAKNGPKMKEAVPGEGGQHMRGRPGDLTADRITMAMFVGQLSRSVGRPVLDKTGLTAKYDFHLEWTPDTGTSGTGKEGLSGPPSIAEAKSEGLPEPTGPSLFTALQEQLGLKLEPQKGPVEHLVIERLEKPSEN